MLWSVIPVWQLWNKGNYLQTYNSSFKKYTVREVFLLDCIPDSLIEYSFLVQELKLYYMNIISI